MKWLWNCFGKPLPWAWLAIASGSCELIFLQRELKSSIFVCLWMFCVFLQVCNAKFVLLLQTLRRIIDRLMRTKTCWQILFFFLLSFISTYTVCLWRLSCLPTASWASHWQIWIELQCFMTLFYILLGTHWPLFPFCFFLVFLHVFGC